MHHVQNHQEPSLSLRPQQTSTPLPSIQLRNRRQFLYLHAASSIRRQIIHWINWGAPQLLANGSVLVKESIRHHQQFDHDPGLGDPLAMLVAQVGGPLTDPLLLELSVNAGGQMDAVGDESVLHGGHAADIQPARDSGAVVLVVDRVVPRELVVHPVGRAGIESFVAPAPAVVGEGEARFDLLGGDLRLGGGSGHKGASDASEDEAGDEIIAEGGTEEFVAVLVLQSAAGEFGERGSSPHEERAGTVSEVLGYHMLLKIQSGWLVSAIYFDFFLSEIAV